MMAHTAAAAEPQCLGGFFFTYSAVGSAEAADLLLGAFELVLGGEGLEDLDNVVPELLVVLVQEDNETSGLGVEG